MNAELKRMWKDAVVAYFKAYFGIRLEELRKITKFLVMIVCGPAEIQIRYIPRHSKLWRSLPTFRRYVKPPTSGSICKLSKQQA
jgi:hypothetical protein